MGGFSLQTFHLPTIAYLFDKFTDDFNQINRHSQGSLFFGHEIFFDEVYEGEGDPPLPLGALTLVSKFNSHSV